MSDQRIEIYSGDITKLAVDAIVNAANERLAPGGGVCGAIHAAAGPDLAKECARIGHCPTGEARLTGGYRLPAKHVIHAVGPVWRGGGEGEESQLASCYRMCLDLARDQGLTSIAFPAISTGIYGFPLEQATRVAVDMVSDWLAGDRQMTRVVFAVFGEQAERAYKAVLS